MESIREVWTGRGMSAFEPILRYWIALLDRIHLDWLRVRNEEPDYPWWYGERANVGLLAAAAIQA